MTILTTDTALPTAPALTLDPVPPAKTKAALVAPKAPSVFMANAADIATLRSHGQTLLADILDRLNK